jgi:MoaA/NifB/PqqE/SkfB family radical SAM enzyme
MKTNTFSIVVGTAACNASCPYCVSKMTQTAACMMNQFDWRRFKTACKIAKQASNGLISVLLTGKGEPLLWPVQIEEYLRLMDGEFPLVDLQTNGILLNKSPLKKWAERGLSLVCISIAHYEPEKSNEIMGIEGDYNFLSAARVVQDAGLSVRLNCTLTDQCYDHSELEMLVSRCKTYGIDQLTVREVARPDYKDDQSHSPVEDWVDEHKVDGAATELRSYILASGGVELLRLPHGASVFDFIGQNVCVNNCLTGTTDPEDIRQIIFFPDGRISYDWRYPGARIL